MLISCKTLAIEWAYGLTHSPFSQKQRAEREMIEKTFFLEFWQYYLLYISVVSSTKLLSTAFIVPFASMIFEVTCSCCES